MLQRSNTCLVHGIVVTHRSSINFSSCMHRARHTHTHNLPSTPLCGVSWQSICTLSDNFFPSTTCREIVSAKWVQTPRIMGEKTKRILISSIVIQCIQICIHACLLLYSYQRLDKDSSTCVFYLEMQKVLCEPDCRRQPFGVLGT